MVSLQSVLPIFEQAQIPYQIRQSPRALRLQVVFRPTYLEVILPRRRLSQRAFEDFFHEQGAYICARWHKIQAQQTAIVHPWPKDLIPGATVQFAGRGICLSPRPFGTVSAPDPDRLWYHPEGDVWSQISAWYLQQGQAYAVTLVADWAQRTGRGPTQVRVRALKGAWGKCTARDAIYLNWLLFVAPLPVLEYVVVHELCHLFFRDHSVRFWDCVASHLPGYRAQVLWLKRYGALLHPIYDSLSDPFLPDSFSGP